MRRSRLLLGVLVTLAAGAVWLWSRPTGFATPEACVRAFYEAAADGDEAGARRCLGEPLRESAPGLLRDLRPVKNVVRQGDPARDGAAAWVDVDEVRRDGTRRVRLRLAGTQGGGWRIVALDSPRELRPGVPYGTHLNDAPDP